MVDVFINGFGYETDGSGPGTGPGRVQWGNLPPHNFRKIKNKNTILNFQKRGANHMFGVYYRVAISRTLFSLWYIISRILFSF